MSTAQAEAERRRQVMAAGGSEQTTGKPSDMPHKLFRDPKHAYCVVNFANAHLPPRTRSGQAAFRILGAFESEALARRHCARRLGVHAQAAVTAVCNLHDWYVIPESADRIGDAPAQLEKLQAAHAERQLASTDAFNRRREQDRDDDDEKKEEEAETEPAEQEPEPTDDEEDSGGDGNSDGDVSELEMPLPESLVLRNQHLAIVSILLEDDARVRDEPAICIWGFAKDQQEAEEFMRCVVGFHVKSYDLHCVDMYEWIYPATLRQKDVMNRLVPVTYRNAEEDRIMRQLRESRAMDAASSVESNAITGAITFTETDVIVED